MAGNLRARIPPSDSLIVYDSNPTAMELVAQEDPAKNTQVAKGSREVAEKSVSAPDCFILV